MRYQLNFKARWRGSDELEAAHTNNKRKAYALFLVAIAGIGVWIIEYLFPNFFNYPYWDKPFHLTDVFRFYPLFLWALVWALVAATRHTSTPHDEKVLVVEVFGYTLTGFWEELAFRWVMIPYSMIGIVVANWFWSAGMGYALGIAAVVLAIKLLFFGDKDWFHVGGALLCVLFAGLFIWFGTFADPVYWFFEKLMVPLANLTTFMQMGSLLKNHETPLFIFGILAANSAFRDGHKYQGLFGTINSWYAGMILIFATMTYGLLVAIVIHAIYDIIFAVTKYLIRKLRG